jgi:hypothetical protein
MRATTTTRHVRILALGGVLALLLAACSTGGTAVAPSGAGEAGADAGEAAISIAAPADGAQVTIPFDVQLDSSVPLSEPETGNNHAHLYFDTDTNAADYDIVYGNTWQVTRELTPGPHTIIVALANPDHSLAGPTQQITVNVAADGAGAPAPAATAPAASGGPSY